jgi:formate--tetrahydrofolate ligase
MNIYGAARVTYAKSAENMINRIKELGLENYPVCIAKTQYSFSADPKAYGIPEGFDIRIRDLVINRGAEMIVAIAGDILRMPGLPSSPQAERIDIIDGQIEGLS